MSQNQSRTAAMGTSAKDSTAISPRENFSLPSIQQITAEAHNVQQKRDIPKEELKGSKSTNIQPTPAAETCQERDGTAITQDDNERLRQQHAVEGHLDNGSSSCKIPLLQKYLKTGNLLSAITLPCLKIRMEDSSIFCETCSSILPFEDSSRLRNHISAHIHNLSRSTTSCYHNMKNEISSTTECILIERVFKNLANMMKAKVNVETENKNNLFKERRNHRKGCYQCGNCNFGSSKLSDFEEHFSERHKEEKAICFYCVEELMDLQSLSSHIVKSHLREGQEGIWRCSIRRCNYFANKREDLLCHFERFHKFSYKITCYNCLKDYGDFKSILDHYDRKLRYKCTSCYLKLKDKNELISHFENIHKGGSKYYMSSYLSCISLFEDSERELKNDEKIQCSMETSSVSTEKSKTKENISIPKEDDSHQKKTLNETDSAQPTTSSEMAPESIIINKCGYCNYRARNENDLKILHSHVLRSHILKPIYCHVTRCVYSSVDYNSLTEHIRFNHDTSNLKISSIRNLYIASKVTVVNNCTTREFIINEKRLSPSKSEITDSVPNIQPKKKNVASEQSSPISLSLYEETPFQQVKKRKLSFPQSRTSNDLGIETKKKSGYLCCFCLDYFPLGDMKSHISQHFKYRKYACKVCNCLFYSSRSKSYSKHAEEHDLDPKDCYEIRTNKDVEREIKLIADKIKLREHVSKEKHHCTACGILLPSEEDDINYHINTFHKSGIKIDLHQVSSMTNFHKILLSKDAKKYKLGRVSCRELFV
ncbi:DgyrCDS7305 [Dimorphilus gyrociliatus]|uniref:DgyrCDS7305 n=1 Tax=Dimorphilus gyrociliatus TaxID=2664684 RepID=A0A7I8VSX3_9ANNE|nr:DgyrCDS7305 [Dimorphilus gyrociliatus]